MCIYKTDHNYKNYNTLKKFRKEVKEGAIDMFGKKEEDRITEVDFNRANVFFMSIKTEQGGNTVIPITTNLSESELKTLVEGYIAQKVN